MLNIDSAQKLLKIYVIVAAGILWLSHLYCFISFKNPLRTCKGEGANILILVEKSEATSVTKNDQMISFVDFFVMQLNIGEGSSQAKVKLKYYERNPIDTVDLDTFKLFTQTDFVNKHLMKDNDQMKPTKEIYGDYQPNIFKRKHFCLILTMGQNLYDPDSTPLAYDRLWENNITVIAVAFDFPHKVKLLDLQSIVSDPSFAFKKNSESPNVLPRKLIDIICRETEVAKDSYDCRDNFPCTIDNLKRNPSGLFPHKERHKFVTCEGVGYCRIDECIVGSLWDDAAKTCATTKI